MPVQIHFLELPLLFTGVPSAVQDWLRQAGVPTSPFRMGTSISRSIEKESGRFVLYDSRSVASRGDAEAARSVGLRTIDLAPLLKPAGASGGTGEAAARQRPDRAKFLRNLKDAVEEGGGLWMRIGDFPFPHQSAVCSGTGVLSAESTRLADLFARMPEPLSPDPAALFPAHSVLPRAKPSRDGRRSPSRDDADEFLTSWVRMRYRSGLPIALDPNLSPEMQPERLRRAGLGGDAFPLMWQTGFDEFSRWWQFRNGISVRLDARGSTYRIGCDGDFGGFEPVVELWRGNYVASIPFPEEGLTVRKDGIVFQQQSHKHPAGFSSRWAEDWQGAAHLHRPELQSA